MEYNTFPYCTPHIVHHQGVTEWEVLIGYRRCWLLSACTYLHLNIYKDACIHTHMYTYTHTCTHSHIHTKMHTFTRTNITLNMISEVC